MASTRRRSDASRTMTPREQVLVTAFFILGVPVIAVLRWGPGEYPLNLYLFLVIVAALISAVVWLLIWLRRWLKRRKLARQQSDDGSLSAGRRS